MKSNTVFKIICVDFGCFFFFFKLERWLVHLHLSRFESCIKTDDEMPPYPNRHI